MCVGGKRERKDHTFILHCSGLWVRYFSLLLFFDNQKVPHFCGRWIPHVPHIHFSFLIHSKQIISNLSSLRNIRRFVSTLSPSPFPLNFVQQHGKNSLEATRLINWCDELSNYCVGTSYHSSARSPQNPVSRIITSCVSADSSRKQFFHFSPLFYFLPLLHLVSGFFCSVLYLHIAGWVRLEDVGGVDWVNGGGVCGERFQLLACTCYVLRFFHFVTSVFVCLSST